MPAAPQPATLAARLLDELPQTQCTRCGYPDCAAYARAIADGEAEINQCPPGGREGIARLARVLGRGPAEAPALNPANGTEGPRTLAVIDETWCIGCTLCLDACPTDAIFGANKRMHTVLPEHCTGCELCVPVCPVDCFELVNASGDKTGWSAWSPAQAQAARQRYAWHQTRLERNARENEDRLEAKARLKLADLAAHSKHTDPEVLDRKRQIIEAALARAEARRNGSGE